MKELIRYFKDRYNPSRYIPVISLVAVTLFHLNHYIFAQHSIPTIIAVITSLLLMFGLLDDLGSSRDNKETTIKNLRIFWLFFFSLFFINGGLLYWLQNGSTIIYTFIGYTFFLKLYSQKIKPLIKSNYLKTFIPVTRFPLTVFILLSEHTRKFATSEMLFFLAFLFIALRIHDSKLIHKKIVIAWLQVLYGVLLVWGLFSAIHLNGMEFYALRLIAIVGFIILAIDYHWKKFIPAFSLIHFTLILNLALLLIKQRQMLI